MLDFHRIHKAGGDLWPDHASGRAHQAEHFGQSPRPRASHEIGRQLILMGAVPQSLRELGLGIWRAGPGRRYLAPLAILIGLTAYLLIPLVGIQKLLGDGDVRVPRE